ncbi:hypothetical protein GO986_16120 [Deinococcus sp. HMF7620]|uniref:Uncharacterized protein n=1 Tax=Deinococcus arboris TaxID=2682977 RepID=A0A7C9HT35_9DEIO|nr:hypothetical protein [Deinococcus arboris]MVN88272.1 hypothetical protein [Deinococcus arboris]
MTDAEKIASLEEENARLGRRVAALETWAQTVGPLVNQLQGAVKVQANPLADLLNLSNRRRP